MKYKIIILLLLGLAVVSTSFASRRIFTNNTAHPFRILIGVTGEPVYVPANNRNHPKKLDWFGVTVVNNISITTKMKISNDPNNGYRLVKYIPNKHNPKFKFGDKEIDVTISNPEGYNGKVLPDYLLVRITITRHDGSKKQYPYKFYPVEN